MIYSFENFEYNQFNTSINYKELFNITITHYILECQTYSLFALYKFTLFALYKFTIISIGS